MAYCFDEHGQRVDLDQIFSNLQTNYQNNINTIYNAIVAQGITPSDKSPSAIATAIAAVRAAGQADVRTDRLEAVIERGGDISNPWIKLTIYNNNLSGPTAKGKQLYTITKNQLDAFDVKIDTKHSYTGRIYQMTNV